MIGLGLARSRARRTTRGNRRRPQADVPSRARDLAHRIASPSGRPADGRHRRPQAPPAPARPRSRPARRGSPVAASPPRWRAACQGRRKRAREPRLDLRAVLEPDFSLGDLEVHVPESLPGLGHVRPRPAVRLRHALGGLEQAEARAQVVAEVEVNGEPQTTVAGRCQLRAGPRADRSELPRSSPAARAASTSRWRSSSFAKARMSSSRDDAPGSCTTGPF
jgi:hypothetical protein